MNTTSTILSRHISLKTLANRTNVILGTTRCYDFQWRAVNLSKRHTETKETNEGFKRCEWTAKWRCEVSGKILYSSDKRGKTSSCVAANNSFYTHRRRRVLIGLVFTYFCSCSILVSRRRFQDNPSHLLEFWMLKKLAPLSHPIRCKAKASMNGSQNFPRFASPEKSASFNLWLARKI